MIRNRIHMNELAIQLSADDGRCLYQQIYEHIKQEIIKGKLLTGERLPSARSLAENLQVARSTVDFAYGQLVAEGYVEARPQRGFFVSQVEELLHVQELLEDDREMGETQEKKKMPAKPGEEILYDFSPHAISMKDFPFATWKKITKDILVDANKEMFALGDARGDEELRITICRYLHSSRGVNCSPGQVIVGAGSDYLFMLLEKILGRHIPIAMEDPTYRRAYKVFQSFAYEVIPVSMDENGMDVEELRKTEARVAYVMPSHQFPTGTVMPIGRRLELLKWAKEKEDRYLIEDDYDSEFRYRSKPIPALQASDTAGKVIYMGTFSKSIAPAIRVGYMVLPKKLLQIYQDNCSFYASTVSRIDQRILNEFIKDGYFERYLNKMRKIYREKHDFLLGLLEPFQDKFRISGENAGLYLLLTSKDNVPEEELIAAAREKGAALYGINASCMRLLQGGKEAFRSTVLLGYGALEKEELEKGIEALKEAWKAYF
jgi:GntR family transcriptional regulator/MocR family aminotransferase